MVGILLRLRTYLASGLDLVILSVFHHCRELSERGAGGIQDYSGLVDQLSVKTRLKPR
jgi:hypothetical protein